MTRLLYQLARAYDTTGADGRSALATLDRIVATYPHDTQLGEVQFRRGELLFSLQRYADAQHAYEAVLALGRTGSTFYRQSLYKRAWSQFKQNQNEACWIHSRICSTTRSSMPRGMRAASMRCRVPIASSSRTRCAS